MARDNIQPLFNECMSKLASIRSGLLVAAQTGETASLAAGHALLEDIRRLSSADGLGHVAELTDKAVETIREFTKGTSHDAGYRSLDLVAQIEAALWSLPQAGRGVPDDVSGFVEAEFGRLVPPSSERTRPEPQAFEIDEETLEVFRAEADELLSAIDHHISKLAEKPDDQAILWEVRRNAHTFKGAAGIVGLTQASALAHRMEDLLDRLVETGGAASTPVLDFLSNASRHLAAASAGDMAVVADLSSLYETAIAHAQLPNGVVGQDNESTFKTPAHDTPKKTSPIIRVALDRLDELVSLSQSLLATRRTLAESLANGPVNAEIAELIAQQHDIIERLHDRIVGMRMVRFGTLETRLARTVNVTCGDEGKKAAFILENADTEIDTQIIDSLIEPLLHLLKNAVVHGIEAPDMRRLIGKDETGSIVVRVVADDEAVVLEVLDDGGGISIPKLKEKAIEKGVIDAERALGLTDRDALRLVFDRGLTTAEDINLNAGRGIGMSIVKECVEACGGNVIVDSTPGQGTRFTLLVPLAIGRPNELEETPTAQPYVQGTPLVLIVDDSASIRLNASKIVKAAGLNVITANNGAEALELLLNGSPEPDLILSDVEMPQIDGWGLLEYLKTDDNLGHIPVVMVTSLDGDEHRQRADELGASAFIVKPFSRDHLEAVLEKVGMARPA